MVTKRSQLLSCSLLSEFVCVMQVLLCYLVLLVLPRILLLSPLLLCLLGQNARNITIKPSLNSYTGVLLLKAICHLFSISAPLIIPCVECGSARLPCSCCQFSQILPPLPFSPPIFIPHSINLMSDMYNHHHSNATFTTH